MTLVKVTPRAEHELGHLWKRCSPNKRTKDLKCPSAEPSRPHRLSVGPSMADSKPGHRHPRQQAKGGPARALALHGEGWG